MKRANPVSANSYLELCVKAIQNCPAGTARPSPEASRPNAYRKERQVQFGTQVYQCIPPAIHGNKRLMGMGLLCQTSCMHTSAIISSLSQSTKPTSSWEKSNQISDPIPQRRSMTIDPCSIVMSFKIKNNIQISNQCAR